VKPAWHSIVIGLDPFSVIVGGVLSTTLTVRVFVPVIPAGSVAEYVSVYAPTAFTFTLPEVVTESDPEQVSLAVAPGSVKLV
jgi:hypothetical protein